MSGQTPSTEIPQRIATLFNRRSTTAWNPKEISAYKWLVKAGAFNDLSDLSLIERYYASERRKGKDGYHRRDLKTFLLNFNGELDRAREWNERFQKHHRPHIQPKSNGEKEATEEDFKRVGTEAKKMIEQLRNQLRPQNL